MSPSHIAELAAKSGGILYLMPLLLLVTLTVSIERTVALARLLSGGRKLISALQPINSLRGHDLAKEFGAYLHQPVGAVLKAVVDFPGVHDRHELEDLLEEAVLHQVPQLDRSLWLLDTAVTLAPLLGLLGTIIGMFNAFQILGASDGAPTQVTGGIAEALTATAFGLAIAIVGLVFFNALHARIRLVVHDMETVKMMLITRIAHQPRDAAR
jgi:biopolymer transport protein ExbB